MRFIVVVVSLVNLMSVFFVCLTEPHIVYVHRAERVFLFLARKKVIAINVQTPIFAWKLRSIEIFFLLLLAGHQNFVNLTAYTTVQFSTILQKTKCLFPVSYQTISYGNVWVEAGRMGCISEPNIKTLHKHQIAACVGYNNNKRQ